MSRKESIYSLLRAKYTLYSLAILIPFVLMVPAMVMDKLTVLSCVAWGLFTAGPVYFGLFQMAVYNTRTVDLNTKLTGRQNAGTGLQGLITGAVFGVPLLLNVLFKTLWGDTVTDMILCVLGAGFILTSRLWIRDVYRRFMKRRYKNLEDFRDSRQK